MWVQKITTRLILAGIATLGIVLAAHGQDQRKVIIIPGILGSELTDASGDVVWGRVSSLAARNFKRLDLLPASGTAAELKPSDVLRKVPLVFGAFSIGLYSDLVDFLVGKPSGLFPDREVIGNYVEGETLFVFPYDWRRSNFANAARLNAFVRDVIPTGEEFDIVAHSMGGLVSRIFLSDKRPQDLCTSADVVSPLSVSDRDRLCQVVYGDLGNGTWPTDALDGPFSEAQRLHTFVEIAVPHRGSVNVAGTFVEGWGRLTEILIGGKRDIQTVLLSMTAPYELAPTYERCCALGETGGLANVEAPILDENYWAEKVLGFGKVPCPYPDCILRREILRIGLANRGVIDAIMDANLPETVKANHVVIGRLVKGTRETVYVDYDAAGDGDAITFRDGQNGDGTVFEGSASAEGNVAYALRSKHAFIVGSDEVHRYVYNVLVKPVQDVPAPVRVPQLFFAGGTVDSVALNAAPQISGAGAPLTLTLDISSTDPEPFGEAAAANTKVDFTLTPYGGDDTPVTVEGAQDPRSSVFRIIVSAAMQAPETPGVYDVRAVSGGTVLAQELLYVLEE